MDIITAVDERIDQTQCGGAMNCHKDKPCLTHFIWLELNEKISEYMRTITLGDISDREDVKKIIIYRRVKMSTLMKQNNSLTIRIYLDYSSTTPVDPKLVKMSECLTKGVLVLTSRSHSFGWESEKLIDEARGHVAKLIKANKKEIVWTSGATESDNLAIKGAAHFYKEKGNHLITLTTEHKAVLDTMRHLETEGFEVTYMNPKDNGLVDIDELKSLIKPTTTVISIMHVNNEIGVIQDLETIEKFVEITK